MITTRDEYLELLYRIQDPNRQTQIIRLPSNEPIYYIDLDKRKIEAPAFLSVEFEHNAETIYFSVDRFYDNVDLSTLFCVVQYNNADPNNKKNGYIYAVPYFDIVTLAEENKMLFQWAIEGPATRYAGTVTFSIKFYRINETLDLEGNKVKYYEYILNTQPSKSKVLHGMDVHAETENYIYDAETVEEIYQRIEEVRRQNELYWIMLDEEFDDSKPIIVNNDYPESTIDKTEDIYNNIILNNVE